MAKLHSSQTNLFVRIEVAQNAGLRHVEVINGDEAFYPQPMKDYGEWLKLFIHLQSYFEPGGCRVGLPKIFLVEMLKLHSELWVKT